MRNYELTPLYVPLSHSPTDRSIGKLNEFADIIRIQFVLHEKKNRISGEIRKNGIIILRHWHLL